MNLNPLKTNDNTDALVKALEDANAVQNPQPSGAMPVSDPMSSVMPDSAAIAADPQVASAGVTPTPEPAMTISDPMQDSGDSTSSEDDTTTDTASGVAFTGNDLPEGLSSDADAHLPSEGSGEGGELDDVKKSALEQLRPLIEKLDLEPADKFDKYLMMLRASDDPALIKPAFEAAQGIDGEKEKAQALLDIINEINYITASNQN